MKKYDIIIAIDCDVEKSGVAYLEVSARILVAFTATFPVLLDYLLREKKIAAESKKSLIVVIEAGWLNQSNWHLKRGDNARVASAKGNSTGRNHETGRKIVEMCKHYGIDVVEQRPLKKCWKGKDGKITHEELAAFTGLTGRTNQDARDAALLGWVFAELPIKLKCT